MSQCYQQIFVHVNRTHKSHLFHSTDINSYGCKYVPSQLINQNGFKYTLILISHVHLVLSLTKQPKI